MRDPNKTNFDLEFFHGMSLPDFKEWWQANLMDGKPEDHYEKLTGEKLPAKTKKDGTKNDR